MTTDPRALGTAGGGWLTNSRVYNLIWLGRWLERSESLLRAMDSAAIASLDDGDEGIFLHTLRTTAEAWGIELGDPSDPMPAILAGQGASSVRISLERARDNAHQVAPLEIITALNGLLVRLDDFDMTLAKPSTLHAFTTQMLAQMADAFAIVEDVWFKREGLSEEELRQRFLQQ